MELEDKLALLPSQPGVYLMKNGAGTVLYVGKAKNLRSRVRSYFRPSGDGRYRMQFLIPNVEDIEFLVTDTEKEALILENTLIKAHKPRFNVNFRDDKSYVNLRLDPRERYPRLTVVRRPGRDGALYFGPYASSQSVRETLRTLSRIFPLRLCTDHVFNARTRPCLYYQIHRCSAPCVPGHVTDDEYRAIVEQTALFLRGRDEELLKMLYGQVHEASQALRFEEAGRVYRRIRAIERTIERQKVTSAQDRDQDVFGFFREVDQVEIQRLTIRGGKLLGGKSDLFTGQVSSDAEILESYVNQYYAEGHDIPEEVLLPFDLEGRDGLADLLSERRGKRVGVVVPERGEKRGLVAMANKNAELSFRARREQEHSQQAILQQIQERLHLRHLPRRIECFDMSNIQGTNPVGSMVVFTDGKPDKARYRKFQVKTVEGPDDFASMYEVLSRRYTRALEEDDLPDLIMVDGGKGQLNIAQAVLWELGIEGPDLISIAKSRLKSERGGEDKRRTDERFFLPGRKNPVIFPANSPALFLLQRVRDEAHRFAITYHKARRAKATVHSALDDIPGVGPKRRRALLRHFGSVKAIAEASPEAIQEAGMVSRQLAETILQAVQREQHENVQSGDL
ncbi:MAG TPA: excinuclease ABC subunit UvrC [Alphaproteobacteria bacterium]|nr:excinuclease ABC subunit UvrC [Alphaproteobacteria bacterium]